MKKISIAVSLVSAVLLSACGSDNNNAPAAAAPPSSSGSSPAAASSAVPSTATGVLVSNQTTANDLVAAVNRGVSTLRSAEGLENAPSSVEIKSLPTGVVTTIDCASFPATASFCTGSYTIDSNITGAITSGSSITVTYNNLVYNALANIGNFVYNGTISTVYDRYVSPNDFRSTITYTNLSFGSASGLTPVNGSSTCDFSNGTINCAYLIDGTQVSNVSVTQSGSVTNVAAGTIRANFSGANGFVDCVYNNWSFNSTTSQVASGGRVTITGSSSTSAVINSNGSGRYTVAITINGSTTNYTVTI